MSCLLCMTSSCMILFGLYHVDDKKFLSKLKLIKFNLKTMLITSWCDHIYLMGRSWFGPLLWLSPVPPARECYGRAYAGPVGKHNLVFSFLFLWYLVLVWDRFAMMVAIGVFGRHGATQDLALRGRWSEWPGRVHDKGRVSSECFGPPEWECEARCSVVWVKCATSAECN